MTSRSRRASLKRSATVFAALLAALALLAAACGSDSDDSSESAEPTETEAPTEEPTPEPTATEEATPEPTATEAPTEEATPEPTPTEVELTASARGVTAEVIKVGVPISDPASIGQNPDYESEDIWQSAADTINANGGVVGRQIELHTVLVDSTDAVSQEAACVALTQDQEVFAVVGVFQGELPLCYTDVYETVAVNTLTSNPEHFEKAKAPYIGVPPLPERAAESQVATLIDSGLLEGATVALSATRGEEGLVQAEAMKVLLEEEGIEVVSVVQYTQPSSDQLAIDAEFDVFIEAWDAAGVDTVIAVGVAGVPTTGALSRTGFDVLYIVTNPSATDVSLLENLGYSADALVGSYAVVPPSEGDMYEGDLAHVKDCIDAFEAANPDSPPVNIRPEGDEANSVNEVVRACQALQTFALVAELAGADLTQESFDAAADALGETTEVTGVILGSLGPGKRDFTDAGDALFRFDEELRRFVLA